MSLYAGKEHLPMKDVRRSVRLDEQTDRLLQRLATRHEGNASFTIRELVRSEAQRAGLVQPTDHRQSYAAQGH